MPAAFVAASKGAGSPEKIAKWVRQWMDDGPATGEGDKRDELRSIQLVHDADKSEVTSWTFNRKTNIQQTARDIYERAKDDAQGLGDERARYILQPYFGQSDGPNGRATFFIQVADPFPEGGDDGSGLTEGPTEKGKTTMFMRHTNDAFRLGLGGAEVSMGMIKEICMDLRTENGVLRQELRDLGEKIRQYENESFERAVRWRKTLFWEKAREELLKNVLPFVSTLVGAGVTKIASMAQGPTPGALPPARPQPPAMPTAVTVGPGAGFPLAAQDPAVGLANSTAPSVPVAAAAPPPATPPPIPGSTTSDGNPTIEARLRRLFQSLSMPQKIALPMVLAKHPSMGPLQKAAGQAIVSLLMSKTESLRANPDAPSHLEIQAAGLFGVFTDESFKQLVDMLKKEAQWSDTHIALLVSAVRDLGKREKNFDDGIAAPFPARPEPVTVSGMSKDARHILGPTKNTPLDAYDPVTRPAPAMPGTPSKAPPETAKGAAKSATSPAPVGTKMPRLGVATKKASPLAASKPSGGSRRK